MPQDSLPSASPATQEAVRYAEVLRVPLRWWALATTFHASVFVAFAVAVPLAVAVAVVVALVLLTAVALVGYGRVRLEVTDTTFRAGRARIPVALLADPRPLSGQETWHAAGPGADARAYLLLRPYLHESVMVQVADPVDPAPYWLVATRRPTQLAAALHAAVLQPAVQPAVPSAEAGGGQSARTGPGVSGRGHGAE